MRLFGVGLKERRAIAALLEAGFEEPFYRDQVQSGDLRSMPPALHFLREGWKNGLDPAPWFSTANYLALYPDVRKAGVNPFLHYAEYGKKEGRSSGGNQGGELVVSVGSVADSSHQIDAQPKPPRQVLAEAFDLAFYNQQLGASLSLNEALDHYLAKGAIEGLDPHPGFSSRAYLTTHPDVAAAQINPYFHYLTRGEEEARTSTGSQFLSRDGVADGRLEWRNYGQISRVSNAYHPGEPRYDLLDFTVTLAGRDLAAAVVAARLKPPIDEGAPTVSVVIPCWEEAGVTAECLVALFECGREAHLEVILVNNGSRDRFYSQISSHPDIIQIDLPENIGFGPATNIGARRASGEFLLLLNNDTQVAPRSLSAMIECVRSDDKVGAVGPKIISFDGRLQESGVILTADGSGQLIGFAADPDDPRFNYVRDVEHLSAAALLLRRDLFLDLDGFDEVYAPAYCEDADLSLRLRSQGYRLRYQPEALVAHHLSKTSSKLENEDRSRSKQKLLSKNRATLLDRWAPHLQTFDIRTIAFYLPQYHPIPENDLWWGKGFTEWRNLAKARPNFVGHRQPRYPADLGYYDLRVPEVMEEQAALASRYGVSGFCYYYYRFGSKRLLETPLERMLETGKPDFPFCLCWANENWSRRWDGMDEDLLMEQSYGEGDAIEFAEDMLRYFRNKNYITVDGKPLVLFYRLQEIPYPRRYIEICRNVWSAGGFPEVLVAMVESFELSAAPLHPAKFGADITVEFPAHGMVHDPAQRVSRLNESWIGNAHDYRELCKAFIVRQDPGFKRLRSVLVGWDTTPRHQDRSLVLRNSTPGAFQAWLEWTYRRTREQNFGDERIVFINAWNEWCEGSYLEPDSEFGHAYLQAVKNAQEAVVMGGQTFVEFE